MNDLKIMFNFYLGSELNGTDEYMPKTAYIKGGEQMKIVDLKELYDNGLQSIIEQRAQHYTEYSKNKEIMPILQTFDCGYRVNLSRNDYDSDEWKHWNGIVWIDIDSHKYAERTDIFDAETKNNVEDFKKNYNIYKSYIEMNLCNHPNYYGSQESFSGHSNHYFFYFNCERNIANFQKCVYYATNLVKSAWVNNCKYAKDLLTYPDVMDSCSSKPAQPIYLSKNTFDFGIGCTGEIDLNAIDFEYHNHGYESNDIIFTSKEYRYNSRLVKMNNYSHPGRWAVMKVFCNFFKDDILSATELYKKYIPELKESVTNHTASELLKLFTDQYRQCLNGIKNNEATYTTMNTSAVEYCEKKFGFKFKIENKFTPQRIEDKQYSQILDLNKSDGRNHRLSDVITPILDDNEHRTIYINAGCGVGKTYSAKYYVRKKKDDTDINYDLLQCNYGIVSDANKNSKRICFVTPMTSINRNNFEDEIDREHWRVIDGEHKYSSYKDRNDVMESEYSIATTWDSFVKYEMSDYSFDVFIFDEAHTLFTYDYRSKIITELLLKLNEMHELKKKIVLMSGTPSKDFFLFSDMYSYKIMKTVRSIPVKFNFYNESYRGNLIKDVNEWRRQSSDNIAIICTDFANQELADKLLARGLNIDNIYNKNCEDDVKYINDHQSEEDKKNGNIRGQIMLISVYGQSGINLYAGPEKKVRMYIISRNAMGIIQYINRLRNTDKIDMVNLYWKKIDIRNVIEERDIVDLDEAKRKTVIINSFNENKKNKDSFIRLNMGMNKDVFDVEDVNGCNILMLNSKRFYIFQNILNNNDSESQLQIVYNRLIEAKCNVIYNYIEEDEKDIYDSKFQGNFSGEIAKMNYDNLSTNKEDRIVFDIQNDKSARRYITGEVVEHMEYIFNYYYKEYKKLINSDKSEDDLFSINESEYNTFDFEIAKKYIKKQFSVFVDKMINREENTIKKVDIKNFKEVLELKSRLSGLSDILILQHMKNDNEINEEWICKYAAGYSSMKFDGRIMSTDDIKCIADEVYENIKHYHKLICDYDWILNSEGLLDETREYKMDLEGMNQKLVDYLYRYLILKHRKKDSGNNSKGLWVKDAKTNLWLGDYNTIDDCAKELGISERTIRRNFNKVYVNKKKNLNIIFYKC